LDFHDREKQLPIRRAHPDSVAGTNWTGCNLAGRYISAIFDPKHIFNRHQQIIWFAGCSSLWHGIRRSESPSRRRATPSLPSQGERYPYRDPGQK
jgi:hypothetical protein